MINNIDKNNNMINSKISVITATYNRKNTLSRVYNSLKNQTYKNFEWIIIDDGSTDNTGELVEQWRKESNFPIIYYYQSNQGKHIAVNKAMEYVSGEYVTGIDSDDEIKSNSFEILLNEWNNIPYEDRKKYKNVTARCYDPETGKKIGKDLPQKVLDCSSLDARYKYKMKYERWGLSRTEVIKKFNNPITKGHFYPETIMQDKCAREYIERYIDIPLRGYYKDTNNSITKKKIKKENIYLWSNNINNNMDYFFYDIPNFLKSFVGISMCGFANNMTLKEIIKVGNNFFKKLAIILFIPLGFILYQKNKE